MIRIQKTSTRFARLGILGISYYNYIRPQNYVYTHVNLTLIGSHNNHHEWTIHFKTTSHLNYKVREYFNISAQIISNHFRALAKRDVDCVTRQRTITRQRLIKISEKTLTCKNSVVKVGPGTIKRKFTQTGTKHWKSLSVTYNRQTRVRLLKIWVFEIFFQSWRVSCAHSAAAVRTRGLAARDCARDSHHRRPK